MVNAPWGTVLLPIENPYLANYGLPERFRDQGDSYNYLAQPY